MAEFSLKDTLIGGGLLFGVGVFLKGFKGKKESKVDSQDWGGDPDGQLAKALAKVREDAKLPKEPLKIEKLDAESFEADDDIILRQQAIDTIEARVADYTTHEDVSPYWGGGIVNPNKYLYFKLRYAWETHPEDREGIIQQYIRGIKDGRIDPDNPLPHGEPNQNLPSQWDAEERKEVNKYKMGDMKVREYDDGTLERYEAQRIQYDYMVHREPSGTEVDDDGNRIPNPRGGRFTSADAESDSTYTDRRELFNSLKVGDKIEIDAQRQSGSHPHPQRKEGIRERTVIDVIDGIGNGHWKFVKELKGPLRRHMGNAPEKTILLDEGETILVYGRNPLHHPSQDFAFYFKKDGPRFGGQHHWLNEPQYRKGKIVNVKSLNAESFESEPLCSCEVPRPRHAGIHPTVCQSCNLIIEAESFDAESFGACPCGCDGKIEDHDDRGYGCWECPRCGDDSDTDMGEDCSNCKEGWLDLQMARVGMLEAESFDAETKKKKKTRRRKKGRRGKKTMAEVSPNLRIDSAFNPNNPMVGHIEKPCSNSLCKETIRTNHPNIGKKCLKCYYRDAHELARIMGGEIMVCPFCPCSEEDVEKATSPSTYTKEQEKEFMDGFRKMEDEERKRLSERVVQLKQRRAQLGKLRKKWRGIPLPPTYKGLSSTDDELQWLLKIDSDSESVEIWGKDLYCHNCATTEVEKFANTKDKRQNLCIECSEDSNALDTESFESETVAFESFRGRWNVGQTKEIEGVQLTKLTSGRNAGFRMEYDGHVGEIVANDEMRNGGFFVFEGGGLGTGGRYRGLSASDQRECLIRWKHRVGGGRLVIRSPFKKARAILASNGRYRPYSGVFRPPSEGVSRSNTFIRKSDRRVQMGRPPRKNEAWLRIRYDAETLGAETFGADEDCESCGESFEKGYTERCNYCVECEDCCKDNGETCSNPACELEECEEDVYWHEGDKPYCYNCGLVFKKAKYSAESKPEGMTISHFCDCNSKLAVINKKNKVILKCWDCSEYVILPKSHLSDSNKRQLILIEEGFQENEDNSKFEEKYPDGITSESIQKFEYFDAETRKLKKDSCCCGATKKNPCECMYQGISPCSSTCPCALENKKKEQAKGHMDFGAESFSAETFLANEMPFKSFWIVAKKASKSFPAGQVGELRLYENGERTIVLDNNLIIPFYNQDLAYAYLNEHFMVYPKKGNVDKGLLMGAEGDDHDHDHDHEDIDELIEKINRVTDFAITFIHDGGFGGEPKGFIVDEDLGLKTEIVNYVEGSIDLRLVRDLETNELMSVRFALTGDPDDTPILYLPLPEQLTTTPDEERAIKRS